MLTYRLLGRNGRLGNQLWQIASTIGIARARGEQAGFPFWRYRPYFSVPDGYFPDLGPPGSTEDIGHDWLQELGHFSDIEDEVRDYFAPSPLAWEPIADYHRALLALPHRTAVHVAAPTTSTAPTSSARWAGGTTRRRWPPPRRRTCSSPTTSPGAAGISRRTASSWRETATTRTCC